MLLQYLFGQSLPVKFKNDCDEKAGLHADADEQPKPKACKSERERRCYLITEMVLMNAVLAAHNTFM